MVDLRVSLGLRLEELRTWANLSRAELANITGIDPRQIADYELYEVWPEPENLAALATGLGVDVHDVFDFTDTRIRSLLPLAERLEKRRQRSDRSRPREGRG
jgi:transcriptional regulator with XRE-family HTH domain